MTSHGIELRHLLRLRPRDWEAAHERATSHPIECRPVVPPCATALRFAGGPSYPLHDAVRLRAPLRVMERILEGCPDALFGGDEWGRDPILLAVDDDAVPLEAIQWLLQEKGKRSHSERTARRPVQPLTEPVRYRLASWHSYAHVRETGQLCGAHEADRARSFRLRMRQFESVGLGGVSGSIGDPRVRRFWSVLLLELQAEESAATAGFDGNGASVCSRRGWSELHSVVRAGCHPSVVGLALHLHPEQARQVDKGGNLPIHLAAAAPSTCNLDEDGNCEGDGGEEMMDTALEVLVRAHPDGARQPDANGRLPLHIALRGGATWRLGGVRVLCSAAPHTLGVPDPTTGLYPFMIAAYNCETLQEEGRSRCMSGADLTADENEEELDLDRFGTVFELLRAFPEPIIGDGSCPFYKIL